MWGIIVWVGEKGNFKLRGNSLKQGHDMSCPYNRCSLGEMAYWDIR